MKLLGKADHHSAPDDKDREAAHAAGSRDAHNKDAGSTDGDSKGFDPSTSRTGEDRDRDLSAPSPDAGPDSPAQLHGKGLMGALKRTFKQFSEDNISDWAAALTYYGVLSIFPGALVLVSILGMLSDNGQKTVQDTLNQVAPSQIKDLVNQVLGQVSDSGTASFAAIIGLLVAFWSASGYIAAFMRASNAIYDVPEGRPIWKTLPIRVGVTAVIGIMMIISAIIVVFTGDLAKAVGDSIGLGSAAVTTWSIAKWPVLVILVSLMFAILYWASPNAKTGGFRWVSPGGIFAVVLWVIASGAFAFYLANFANYNKTYGTLGGVIAFLVWLWISNIAIMLGAELDAELERGRAIAAGHSPDDEPFLQLRDDRKLKKGSEKGLSTN
ncbi:YihY/virulence factor BrkB family protein [Actinoplanes sp. N902-109]|uniref:YihY/virulence factor BrkB family protein n=1 Tax=Actinoplanes sp. (strain N902-109) TaxID=649831 RepID=UPI0003294EFA|nr:YihY/virulence factor BrkB family protein [Actinoplanes sp. N902-109]AGL15170.1 ribonuclease bn [Actinoplanes sp. N902-109]